MAVDNDDEEPSPAKMPKKTPNPIVAQAAPKEAPPNSLVVLTPSGYSLARARQNFRTVIEGEENWLYINWVNKAAHLQTLAQLLMIPVSGRVQLKGRGLLDPTWLHGTRADPAGYR